QQDLAKIGIKTKIRIPPDITTFTNSVRVEGTYDISISADTPVTPNIDLFREFHSAGGGNNPGLVKDPQIDAMIDQQSILVKDPAARKKILQDLQRAIINQAQSYYLAGGVAAAVRWKYVQNFYFTKGIDEVWPPVWFNK